MFLKSSKTITLKLAKIMGERAIKKSKELGKSFVFTVVDAGGHIVYLEKMDGAFISSLDISINKAYTAAIMQRSTDLLTDKIKPESELFGLNHTNDGRIVPFGGGMPIVIEGEVIGAVGVSGGKVEEDMAVASYSLEILKTINVCSLKIN